MKALGLLGLVGIAFAFYSLGWIRSAHAQELEKQGKPVI